MTAEDGNGSIFTSHGYGGFDKKSGSAPFSKLSGIQTAWKVTWRLRHIINKDDVACIRSASFLPTQYDGDGCLLKSFTSLRRVHAFLDTMTWPVRTMEFVEQKRTQASPVSSWTTFSSTNYLQLLFETQRHFELDLSTTRW